MGKKTFGIAISIVFIILLFSGCGGDTVAIPFNGMLDSDNGKTYKLGDSKDVFDDAFGESEFNEETGEYSYLSEVLTVAFDENNSAVRIESSGKSNRFEFYDFNFDKPLKEIEGRYEKFDKAIGYIFYSKYFDESGEPCSSIDAICTAQLMVRRGDMEILNLKDGEYVSYLIEKRKSVEEILAEERLK